MLSPALIREFNETNAFIHILEAWSLQNDEYLELGPDDWPIKVTKRMSHTLPGVLTGNGSIDVDSSEFKALAAKNSDVADFEERNKFFLTHIVKGTGEHAMDKLHDHCKKKLEAVRKLC